MLHLQEDELTKYRILPSDCVLIEINSIHNLVELSDFVLKKNAFPFFAFNRGMYSEVIYNKNHLNKPSLLTIVSKFNREFLANFIINPGSINTDSYIMLESPKLHDMHRILNNNGVMVKGLKYDNLESIIMRSDDVQLMKFTTDKVRSNPTDIDIQRVIVSVCLKKIRTQGLGQKYKTRFEEEFQAYTRLGLLGMIYDVYQFKKMWKGLVLRGSANNSLICWLLDISMIDPVRFDLPFERFINRKKIWSDT